MSDYYSTLGINRSASQEEIKQAYRRMAKQHHPDRGGDTAQFQKIEEAYRILSDPQKKQDYDSPAGQNFQQFNGGMGGFEDLFKHFGFNSPFGDIFGQRHSHHRNRTLNLETVISLEEAFYGKDLVANVTLPSGRDQIINVKIPAGINDGTTLRLAGIGDDTVPGMPRGDLHLNIRVAPHNTFLRQGDDLITEAAVPVWSAILGDKILVNTLDGKQLEVTIPQGTQHDQTMAIQGQGMPAMSDARFRGRLLVKIKLQIPDNLSEQQKVEIKKIIS